MTFLPILDRIALVKKKKTLEEMQNDGQNPNFLAVAPRSFTQKEITSKIEQSLKDCGTQMKTIEKANHFKDRKDLIEIETNTAEPALQRLFKSRIAHNEEVFKAANDGDEAVPRAKTTKDEDMRYDKDEDDEDKNDDQYWFTKDKIEKIKEVHNYLDALPAVGKVLSFSSIIEVATQLNNNKPLGGLEIGVLYSKIPDNIKKDIIDPYISIKDNEARISLRIIDSQDGLRRNDLIKQINYDLKNKLELKEEEFKLAGVLILFNNLLQSLFKSQILTLGLVMIGIFAMFIILFRNIKLSLIGVVPNFIAAFFILGIIGLLGIPLDMMTITIAAITIGIAVDNSIHYIYRFKEEFLKHKDYNKTLKICHSTVGVAILNTSITIVFGFKNINLCEK